MLRCVTLNGSVSYSRTIPKKPNDKLYCDTCECYFSRANKAQHNKTKKHIKAKQFNECLLKLAKSKYLENKIIETN